MSDNICGYLSADGTKILTASGEPIMFVVKSPAPSSLRGKSVAVTAQTADGTLWWGQGTPRMAITMRPHISKRIIRKLAKK
jgi:hypothetical protein